MTKELVEVVQADSCIVMGEGREGDMDKLRSPEGRRSEASSNGYGKSGAEAEQQPGPDTRLASGGSEGGSNPPAAAMTPPKKTTIIQPALLPCPFCGRALERRMSGYFGHPNIPTKCPLWNVAVDPEIDPAGVEVWNTRAQLAPVEQDVEKVARALFESEEGRSVGKATLDYWFACDENSRGEDADCKRHCDWLRGLARTALSTLTPARAEGFKAGDYNYRQLFNAIAAATSPYGGGTGVNVSVKAFLAALKDPDHG